MKYHAEPYRPDLDELWFKEKMLSDEATMSYNHAYGGTITFDKERRPQWYEKWILDEKEHYYRYLKSTDDSNFVGEIALHKEAERWLVDVLVYAPFRHNGYGQEGLVYLTKEARRRGIKALYDEIAKDNSSIKLFLKNGFVIESINKETITVRLILD